MSSFSWTTPERHNGERRLPLIPNEVYFQIFNYIPPDSTGKSFAGLSLICRFFCAYFLAKSYEELTLVCESPRQQHVNLCRQLASRDQTALSVAKYVKRCSIVISQSNATFVEKGYLGTFLFALRYMSNLLDLTLTGVELNPKMIQTVTRLAQLKRLSLEWPTWGSADPAPLYQLEKLCSVEITGGARPSWSLIPPEFLKSRIQLTRLTCVLWEEIVPLLRMHAHEDVSLPLKSLTLGSVDDAHLFREFLIKTPTLEELQVVVDYDGSQMSPTTIPHLRVLICPPTWFNSFLGGLSVPKKLSVLATSHTPFAQFQVQQSRSVWTKHAFFSAKKLVIPVEWAKVPLFSGIIGRCSVFGLRYDSGPDEPNFQDIGGKETVFANVTSLVMLGANYTSEADIPFVRITQKFPMALSVHVDGLGEWLRPVDAKDEWRKTKGTPARVSLR